MAYEVIKVKWCGSCALKTGGTILCGSAYEIGNDINKAYRLAEQYNNRKCCQAEVREVDNKEEV